MTQAGPLDREAIFWHFPHYRGGIVPYSIIRQGRWKLIKRYEHRTFELFDLDNDLSEKTNLAPQRPELAASLDATLSAWLAHTGARLPRPNPAYRGA